MYKGRKCDIAEYLSHMEGSIDEQVVVRTNELRDRRTFPGGRPRGIDAVAYNLKQVVNQLAMENSSTTLPL
jgi:hypothetical protein